MTQNLLLDQFDLVWALADLHLETLSEDDFDWAPTPLTWTVRQDAAGDWRPDWADTEPDPIPVPTIAWLTWQIQWYWSVALDHMQGRPPRDRESVLWPGTGAASVSRLRELSAQWRSGLVALSAEDLLAPAAFPWPADSGRTVGHMVSWCNVELTKNVAEIGQLRLIRATSP
jgi:hypothetical protein